MEHLPDENCHRRERGLRPQEPGAQDYLRGAGVPGKRLRRFQVRYVHHFDSRPQRVRDQNRQHHGYVRNGNGNDRLCGNVAEDGAHSPPGPWDCAVGYDPYRYDKRFERILRPDGAHTTDEVRGAGGAAQRLLSIEDDELHHPRSRSRPVRSDHRRHHADIGRCLDFDRRCGHRAEDGASQVQGSGNGYVGRSRADRNHLRRQRYHRPGRADGGHRLRGAGVAGRLVH